MIDPREEDYYYYDDCYNDPEYQRNAEWERWQLANEERYRPKPVYTDSFRLTFRKSGSLFKRGDVHHVASRVQVTPDGFKVCFTAPRAMTVDAIDVDMKCNGKYVNVGTEKCQVYMFPADSLEISFGL